MKIFFLFLAMVFTLPAFAKHSKHENILEETQKKYSSVQSFEAELVQEVYQASLGRTKTSKGILQLQKPKLLRWETHEPEASVLVSNGYKLWYFTPAIDAKAKGQAIERKAKDLLSQPLYRILTGSASFEKEFKIIDRNKVGNDSILTLKPLKPLGETEKVKLTISQEHEITEILLLNKDENSTRIRLQNTKLGGKFPPNLFDFKPPPGTDLIKE